MGKKTYLVGEAGSQAGMLVSSLRIKHDMVAVFEWCRALRQEQGYDADTDKGYDPIRYRTRIYEFDEDKPDEKPRLLKGAGLIKFLDDHVYAALHLMKLADKEAALEAAKPPKEADE